MSFVVYIIYSSKLNKYYAGHAQNLSERLERHNSRRSSYTARGVPWVLIKTYKCYSRKEAMILERKIKGRGIRRFLNE